MRACTLANRRGFSLVELVIVVVIIGIIGAIAIPRMSRGASSAGDSALTANLTVLRNAIDMYHAEHNNTYPTVAAFTAQMTTYSNVSGSTNATADASYPYGPYLRAVPPLPVGAKKGSTGVAAADAAGIGWIYDQSTGAIVANTGGTEKDAGGKAYNTY